MITNPSVFLGWNGLFKGEVNHLALSAPAVRAGAEVSVEIRLALSHNGVEWAPQRIYGDLAGFTKSAGGPGAFELMGLLRFANAWWAFGAIWKSANLNEAALFRSEDGRNWSRIITGFEHSGGANSYRHFAFCDAQGSTVALLKQTGELVHSTDSGVTWSQRTDVVGWSGQFGSAVSARGLVLSANAIAVIGSVNDTTGFRIKTSPTPSGVFTDRGAPWGIKNVSIVSRGNVALGFSIYSPGLGTTRSAFAPINSISQAWADAGFTNAAFVDRAFFVLNHWYVGSPSGGWFVVKGLPGTGAWLPSVVPWTGVDTPNSGYERNGRAFAHFGLGQIAVSDDGADWDVVESSGLEPVRYFAAAA